MWWVDTSAVLSRVLGMVGAKRAVNWLRGVWDPRLPATRWLRVRMVAGLAVCWFALQVVISRWWYNTGLGVPYLLATVVLGICVGGRVGMYWRIKHAYRWGYSNGRADVFRSIADAMERGDTFGDWMIGQSKQSLIELELEHGMRVDMTETEDTITMQIVPIDSEKRPTRRWGVRKRRVF